MIFNRAFFAPGNDQDRFDSRSNGFFDRVLNQRLIDERQHLFRRSFGCGQKSGSQSGGGKNGFANFLFHMNTVKLTFCYSLFTKKFILHLPPFNDQTTVVISEYSF